MVESDSNGDLYRIQSSIDLCKLTSALSNPRNPVYLFDLLLSNNINIKFPVEKLIKMQESEKLEFLIKCLDEFYLNVLNLSWNELVFEVQSKPVLMVLEKYMRLQNHGRHILLMKLNNNIIGRIMIWYLKTYQKKENIVI